jgi:hypothetical protein
MYCDRIDKLLLNPNDEVNALRLARLARTAPDSATLDPKNDVGMLAPRRGIFKLRNETEYFAEYKGEEIQVSPADVAGMKAHGFKVLDGPGQPFGYGKSMPSDIELRKQARAAELRNRR